VSVVLSEHLPLLASAPDGIEKLRGLILELAVRGKLVPQDPNDEPASELLKRIAKERARLEAGGIFKKSKTAPCVSKAAQPRGWMSAILPELCEIGGGATPSKAKSDYWDGGLPWVSPKDMKVDQIFDARDHVTELALRETRLPRVPAGSLLVVVRGMILAHSFPVATTQVDVAINQDMKSLTLFLPELQPFLALALRGWKPQILALVDRSTHGTCKLQSEKLFAFEFGIPPLTEQHRIVAKVEELMTLCDRLEAEQADAEAAHAKLVETLLGTLTQSTDAAELAANWQRLAEHFGTLFTTEASLDALKQTILQLAVMGKLVPQDPNDEPASELLKRIAKEKDRLCREEGLRTTAEPQVLAEDQYIQLPFGWSFERLGNLAKFIDYRGRTPEKIQEGVPLITAKNVRFGFISREPREFVSEREYSEWMTRGFPRIGDILFTTEAPLGNVAVVDIHEKFALAQRVICFQFHEPRISPFLRLGLMSELVRQQIGAEATGMTATGIKAARLKEIPVPIPPLAEQHRIVAKVDELMALCDRLKADLAESRARQARLSATLIESALQAA